MPELRCIDRPTAPLRGLGLFSGRPATVTIHPGPAPLHITLTEGNVAVGSAPVAVANLTDSSAWTGLPANTPIRNTTLRADSRLANDPAQQLPVRVAATVEHLLAALAGLNIWDAWIQLEGGPEVPILDGSALPFINALRPVAVHSDSTRAPVILTRPLEVRAGEAVISAVPSTADEPIRYTYHLDYGPSSPIATQTAVWNGSTTDFIHHIAPARTFSLEREARAARAAGLFSHLSPRDMLVVGDDGQPIDNAWRFEHEPARHKLLDLIGDLALLGAPLHAHVTAARAGHALTHEFCRAVLLTEPDA